MRNTWLSIAVLAVGLILIRSTTAAIARDGDRVYDAFSGESNLLLASPMSKRPLNEALSPAISLFKRQQTCQAGSGLCATGQCCPLGGACCTQSSCASVGSFCCGLTQCNTLTEVCCGGGDGCAPMGAECCGDKISFCERGNRCYKFAGQVKNVCCTDENCTARVMSGTTMQITTPVVTEATGDGTITAGGTAIQTFTYTLTWSFYSYFSRFDSSLSASVVTSAPVTRTTVVSVTATDSSAATSSLQAISSRLPMLLASATASISNGTLVISNSTTSTTNLTSTTTRLTSSTSMTVSTAINHDPATPVPSQSVALSVRATTWIAVIPLTIQLYRSAIANAFGISNHL